MVYYYDILNAQRGHVKPVRPRRPQARLALRLSWRRPLPTSTRSPRRARASDKSLEAAHTTMVGGTGRTAQPGAPDDRPNPRGPFMEPLRQKVQVDPMTSESIAIQRRNADKKLERQLNISFAEVRLGGVHTPSLRAPPCFDTHALYRATTAGATAHRAVGNRAQLTPSRPPIVS